MSEDRLPHTTAADESTEAMEMLGKGYSPRADDQTIIDASDLRKYRIELPNLYDDSDLDPYEFRLLAHYKRVGRCTEGIKTTAKKCHMSAGQVSEKRQSLAGKGFISAREVPLKGGGHSFIITVLDRWAENFKKYAPVSLSEYPPSCGETPPSHSETKKELLIKNQSSLTPAQHSQLSQFVDRFGKFNNTQEADTILALFEKHGTPKILEVFEWVLKKEIHLTNRSSLVDSIQTAAERWSGRKERKHDKRNTRRAGPPAPEPSEADIQSALATLKQQAAHV